MPIFKNEIAKRCARWLLQSTAPERLKYDHPVKDDIAAACDEIERLHGLVMQRCQEAGHCLHGDTGCICDVEPR